MDVINFGQITHRSGRRTYFAKLPNGEVIEHGTLQSPGVCLVSLLAERGFTFLHHDPNMDEVRIGDSKRKQVQHSHKLG